MATPILRTFVAAAMAMTTGCMSYFVPGPAHKAAYPRKATVRVASCTTPKRLFDCAGTPSVRNYLSDLLRLNGFAVAAAGEPSVTLHLNLREDRNVVAAKAELKASSGTVWTAEGEGDTVITALMRLEEILEQQAGFSKRLLRADDFAKAARSLGRKSVAYRGIKFLYK